MISQSNAEETARPHAPSRYELANERIEPVPSRSALYRALVRHHLLVPTKRRRQRGDYKR